MTAYLFSCTDEFYTSLETLINMVLTPHFTPENVAKEQGIIGQEIKMCEDRPSEALHYNLLKALYKKNPIRIPIAGTIESIAMITPELLYDCYKSYYRMSNMTLCVCGDIDVDKIEEIVNRLVPVKNEGSVVFTECKEDIEVNEKSIRVEMDVATPLFKVGIKFPEGTPENDEICAVLSETLFGESEDFFSELYEDGLISSYSNYYDSSRSASHFVFGGDSDDPEAVFERFLAYAEKIKKIGVSSEAVERSKRVLYAEALRGYDSTENVVMNLFESFITGVNGLECAEKYMKVTLDDVSALLPLVLDEKRFAMSVVYPKKQ
jgi:predicted Zn-dependent peptidase